MVFVKKKRVSDQVRRAAAMLGRRGGLAKSQAKTIAARRNGRIGGLSTSVAKAVAAATNGTRGGRPRKPVVRTRLPGLANFEEEMAGASKTKPIPKPKRSASLGLRGPGPKVAMPAEDAAEEKAEYVRTHPRWDTTRLICDICNRRSLVGRRVGARVRHRCVLCGLESKSEPLMSITLG